MNTKHQIKLNRAKSEMVRIECHKCLSIYKCSKNTLQNAFIPFKNQSCVFCGQNGWLEYNRVINPFRPQFTQQNKLKALLLKNRRKIQKLSHEKSQLGEDIREQLETQSIRALSRYYTLNFDIEHLVNWGNK